MVKQCALNRLIFGENCQVITDFWIIRMEVKRHHSDSYSGTHRDFQNTENILWEQFQVFLNFLWTIA